MSGKSNARNVTICASSVLQCLTRSSYVVEFHCGQHPLPTNWTILHLSRALKACHNMSTVVERRICCVIPANSAQSLLFLRVLPVCDTLTELLVMLPATNICVAGCCLNERSGTVLLVIHPAPVISVTILEGVKIGRASCRERVWSWVVEVVLQAELDE